MGLAAEELVLDRAGFLDWEAGQEMRHEFYRGEVFAMTGARQAHAIVSGNCYALLKSHLRGKPCRAFVADMQVDVAAADAVFYPDVVVTCDPADLAAERTLRQPRVIIEVLSETTAAYDRDKKFASYRQLASLEEYVLVAPESRGLEIYRRTPAGDWLLALRDAERGLILPSLDFSASLAEVFEDLDADGLPLAPPLAKTD
jgi:Uma2 family endonuclease